MIAITLYLLIGLIYVGRYFVIYRGLFEELEDHIINEFSPMIFEPRFLLIFCLIASVLLWPVLMFTKIDKL